MRSTSSGSLNHATHGVCTTAAFIVVRAKTSVIHLEAINENENIKMVKICGTNMNL